MRNLRGRGALNIVLPVMLAAACSAGGGGDKNQVSGTGGISGVGGKGPGGAGGLGGFGGSGGSITPTCTTNCTDFPEQPIFEGNAPQNAPSLFGPVDPGKFTGPPPCVFEPQLSNGNTPGALFPANWLRPRFRFAAPGDLFEIRVHSEVQKNDLVAYTTNQVFYMPVDVWKKAGPNNGGKPMQVTIRSMAAASPGTQSGYQGEFMVAPVNAGGTMVFWTVKDSNVGPESSKLLGFGVGDEGVAEVLAPKRVLFKEIIHENGVDLRGEYGGAKPGFLPGEVQCIGCHTSTPDGAAVVFTDDWPWNKAIAGVEENAQGQVPGYVSPGARALLKMPWMGTQSMSKGHWAAGDRKLVASYGARSAPFFPSSGQQDRLIWIDLETQAPISDMVPPQNSGMRQQAADQRNQAIVAAKGTAWDILAMEGETGNAVTPDFANQGDRILYVSTDITPNGHPSYDATRADVKIVPFNGGKGGAVTPVQGASDPNLLEYYPSFSADDALIAFNRAPGKNQTSGCPGSSCPDGPYYNRYAEISVLPTEGGTPHRLVANDPVACAGDSAAQGLINSWPKWSPNVASINGKTYYFLLFSSARNYPGRFDIPRAQYTPPTLDTRSSQLYMAAIVRDDATGKFTSFPAIYLWNQNRLVVNGTATDIQTSNLTPAWDEFLIPPVVAPPR